MRFLERFKPKTENRDINFQKISYSQCGEDLIIRHIFDALKIKNPSFIDVGAHHPFYMSNTATFYLSGSSGINIEPDPVLFERFKVERQRDINLNIGISEIESESDFYIISTPTLNTFSKEIAYSYENEGYKVVDVKKIKTLSIQQIIERHCNGKFPEFLSLDAEGVDELILKSIDFEMNAPIVICIETISFSNTGHGQKNTEIIHYLESKGYLLYADTNINSIFVLRAQWERHTLQ